MLNINSDGKGIAVEIKGDLITLCYETLKVAESISRENEKLAEALLVGVASSIGPETAIKLLTEYTKEERDKKANLEIDKVLNELEDMLGGLHE